MNTSNLNLSAFDIWKSSFEIFKKYWTFLLATSAISLGLSMINAIFSYTMYKPYEVERLNEFTDKMERVVNYDIVPFGVSAAVNSVSILVFIIGIILGFNLIKMMFKMYEGQEVKVSEYWAKPADNFWKYILTIILFAVRVVLPLAIVFGAYGILRLSTAYYGVQDSGLLSILFILLPVIGFILIPFTIYWSFIYGQSIYLAIENRAASATEALEMSKEMTVGKFWKIWWFNMKIGLIVFGIILLGLIAFLVGVIPAAFIVINTSYMVAITLYKKLYAARYEAEGVVNAQ